MSSYVGDFRTGKTIRKMWNSNAIAGESITRATNGTISVYKDGGTTQSTTGVTDTEDFDSLTGVHLVAIDTSADGTFYSAASDFEVVLSAATIDGKTINATLFSFSLENRSFLMPTTDGRKLDVSSTGEAGVDWANVGSPTTTLALTGTTIATTQKVDVETIKTNPVVNAGTITFPTTATLASTTNITAGTVTTATNVTTVNGLAANVITATSIQADAITDAKVASDVTIASVTGAVGSVTGAVGSVTGNVGGNVTGSVGSVVAGVTLANGAHGGAAATLQLGASSATPAFLVTNSAGVAVSFQSSTTHALLAAGGVSGGGHGICATGGTDSDGFNGIGNGTGVGFRSSPVAVGFGDLPPKNVALSNIEFLMVDATDHVTPEVGLTVTGEKSIDGGAFGAVTGAIAGVGNGIYQFDASAADMNGTIITFRFTSAGAADRFLTIKTSG